MQKTYITKPSFSLLRVLQILIFFCAASGFSQTVSVNNGQSAESLVDMLLNDACADISNTSSSSTLATGSFNNNGGAFPLQSGVIIRTGDASFTSGAYTGNNLDSQLNTNSDPYLQELSDRINSGTERTADINETSFLEFNFVPISNSLNFDFLLASNEYGEQQCYSSDVLAFVLTDLATGEVSNLAVIPGSATPISVQTIRDNTYNAICASVNADLFSTYEVDNPKATINMRGYTQVMTASSALVPGREYKIRIVIGDANGSDFDSAIFLSAGSFNTGVNLGPDFSLCDGDTRILDAGINEPGYTFTWFRDNALVADEISNKLTITEAGTYRVEATRAGSTCKLDDEIVVENPMVIQPKPLTSCFNPAGASTFNLGINNLEALGLDPDEYTLLYFKTPTDIANNNPIPADQIAAYLGKDGETIYIKLRSSVTNNICNAEFQFNLSISNQISVTPPADLQVCPMPGMTTTVDLSTSLPTFRSGLDPGEFQVTYYTSEANAQSAMNPIDINVPYTIPATSATFSIWLRVTNNNQQDCFVVNSFQVIVGTLPPVATMPDVVVCGSLILPDLPEGQGDYYTQASGEGSILNAGDVINGAFTQTVYIYNESPDGCPSEPSSFRVTIVDLFSNRDLDGLTGCETEYQLPTLPDDAGAFYTAPNGGGRRLAPRATLNKSQTVYYFAEVNGAVCVDKSFNITLDPLPKIDKPDDVIICDSYILPALINGRYDTRRDGQGATPVEAGDIITTTQRLYVYDKNIVTGCEDSNGFLVFIAPDKAFFEKAGDGLDVCGEYNLPKLERGAYYRKSNGLGTPLPMNEPLPVGKYTIYYFVRTTLGTNCTTDLSFEVNVKPTPPVDEMDDVVSCVSDGPYILPVTTNGEYFTAPDRKGTPLAAGDPITTDQTIYINNIVDDCPNESNFKVEIRPLPLTDNFVTAFECDAYTLPVLKNGTYYSLPGGPSGGGAILQAGDVIDTTQTIYIYNAYSDLLGCFVDRPFTINILGVDVGDFDDVMACDAYILPNLPVGDYYTAPRGRGTKLNPNTPITETQKIFVYASNGTRFICFDEESFTVTVSETPVITLLADDDIEACGSFALPPLDQTNYDFGYFLSPNGQDPVDPSEYFIDQPGAYTFYRYATAKNNPDCSDEDIFQVTVYPLLDFTVAGGTICTDAVTGQTIQSFVLESGLDPTEFEVSWILDGTVMGVGPNYEAVAAGTYTVTTQKLNPIVGAACPYNPTTVEVLASSQPLIEAEVSQPFADVSVITVTVVNGDGDYQYQLDGGDFQESNVFNDVQAGMHEITAIGVTGNCSSTTIDINVINYPKFFTPNADGFNDVWNLDSLREDFSQARILIFNRYGKLLKTIFPNTNGWDGTYRGSPVPSGDYWFKVEYTDNDGNPVEFKAHFTLKR